MLHIYIYIYIYIYDISSLRVNDLYFAPIIVWVIKSRRIRLTEHVARVAERRGVYRWGNIREKDHLEDPGLDGCIILR